MKRVLAWLMETLLMAGAVFCALGGIIDGYSFDVNLAFLAIIWLITAGVLASLAKLWKGKGIIVCAVLVLALFFSNLSSIVPGFRYTVFEVSRQLGRWLPVSAAFEGASASSAELSAFFTGAGALLMLLLLLTICLRRSAMFTIALTLPFFLLSVILLDFQPNPLFYIGLIAIWLTMLYATALKPRDTEKGNLTLAPAILAAVALLSLAYFVASPGTHERSEVIKRLDNYADRIFGTGSGEGTAGAITWAGFELNYWRFNTERSSVADSGRRIITNQKCLEIVADQAGSYYLRGFSMPYFDGRSWTEFPDNIAARYNTQGQALSTVLETADIIETSRTYSIIENYNAIFPENALTHAYMTIKKVADKTNAFYRPYYSSIGSIVIVSDSGEAMELLEDQLPLDREITTDFYYTKDNPADFAQALAPFYSFDQMSDQKWIFNSLYTYIEPGTAESLRAIAGEAGIDANADREVVADQVADFVSSCAGYSLNPSFIPSDEDFAAYFIESAERGYCVHFATAATLMLRALDIPARFVNGFTVTVSDRSVRQTVIVTDAQAHSWVEVYYDNVGWVPLEATPSTPGSEVPERTPRESSAPSPTPAPPQESLTPDETNGESGNAEAEDTKREPLPAAFWVALGLVLAAPALPLRRFIAQRRRSRDFKQSNTNAAVIAAWQYILRMYGKEIAIPGEIEELALKAKFSQHTLTENERRSVISYATKTAAKLDACGNAWDRFIFRYIRGLR